MRRSSVPGATRPTARGCTGVFGAAAAAPSFAAAALVASMGGVEARATSSAWAPSGIDAAWPEGASRLVPSDEDGDTAEAAAGDAMRATSATGEDGASPASRGDAEGIDEVCAGAAGTSGTSGPPPAAAAGDSGASGTIGAGMRTSGPSDELAAALAGALQGVAAGAASSPSDAAGTRCRFGGVAAFTAAAGDTSASALNDADSCRAASTTPVMAIAFRFALIAAPCGVCEGRGSGGGEGEGEARGGEGEQGRAGGTVTRAVD